MRRKRGKTEDVGGFGVTASSQVGKTPSQTTVTAKCPRLRYRMRERAAIALRSPFEFAVRETTDKAAVAFSSYMYSVAKLLKNPAYSDTFCKISYGLIENCMFEGSTFCDYNLFFSALPAPVPLYFERVVLKSYESERPMLCV